jgi:hypothetical protein
MDALELTLRDGLPLSMEQMEDESFDLVTHAMGSTQKIG